ncbi:MAG: ribulokinase [Akkermansiaceae bacterium]
MYSIGLDYGTNSCRSLIVNLETGEELGSAVFDYPSGEMGVLTDAGDPNVARQNPQDYLDGCEVIVREAMRLTGEMDGDFSAEKVVGIGVDTTGSTVIPVAECGTPLALLDEFRGNLNAAVWLWKDHTSYREAEAITELAKVKRPEYLAKCGGTYSSEWWWSKILHLKNVDGEVFEASYSFVEHCDWLTAELAGDTNPLTLKRSVCAAGHKAMFSDAWGGLPDVEFLAELDPALAGLRERLFERVYASDERAGELSAAWAERLGLPVGIAIAVGAFDCHMGAVGAGVKEGTLVKIIGTSTCDITVAGAGVADVPGLCGQVDSSVVPGFVGLEAGQSAVGDLFLWLVNNLVPESYGADMGEKFASLNQFVRETKPGESGLMALDWNNGNRTILTDVRLTGMLLGQTLHTKAHEIYRAYIEATAFGAATIIRRMEEHGVEVNEVVNTGGISLKSPELMQIYADVIGKPMRVSAVDQTCAMGAAIFAAVAAGYSDLATLQGRAVKYLDVVYEPIAENVEVYAELYQIYRQLHDGFGRTGWSGTMENVMKDLIRIREQQRR